MRGIHGLRLWRFLLLEPLLAIVLGTLVGLALGAVGTVVTTRTWLDDAAAPLGRPALLAAAAHRRRGLVIVALSAAAALREPLAVQVSSRADRGGHHPGDLPQPARHRRGRVSRPSAAAAPTASPTSLVLLGPALVGLALGQVAIWLIRIAARGFTPVTERRGIAPSSPPAGWPAPTTWSPRSASSWPPPWWGPRPDRCGQRRPVDRGAGAASRSPAPGSSTRANGAIGALDLTERARPRRDQLMATAIVRNEGASASAEPTSTPARWDAVVGDFYDDAGPGRVRLRRPPRTDAAPLQTGGGSRRP